MEINVKLLKRDDNLTSSILEETNEFILTKKPVSVLIPKRYEKLELVKIEANVFLIASFPIIYNGKYILFNKPILIESEPESIEEVKIDNVDYYLLNYREGDKLLVNKNAVKRDKWVFDLFEETIIKSNIPFYLDYEDLYKLFEETGEYADSKFSINPGIIAALISIAARDRNNLKKYYREGDMKSKPKYIGLNDIYLNYTTTYQKITGSYLSKGILSALVDESDKETDIEKVLKK